jgi:uncharacterized DUF497 family protein
LGSSQGEEQLVKTRGLIRRSRHGVSDPAGLDGEDIEHSGSEERRLRLAKSSLNRVLLIAYTVRRIDDEEVTRIIGARRASRKERDKYEVEEN